MLFDVYQLFIGSDFMPVEYAKHLKLSMSIQVHWETTESCLNVRIGTCILDALIC